MIAGWHLHRTDGRSKVSFFEMNFKFKFERVNEFQLLHGYYLVISHKLKLAQGFYPQK